MPEFFPIRFFDGADVELQTPPVSENAQAAWQAFQELTSANRKDASRHVYASYLDFHDASDGVDWLDEKMGVPAQFEDIWAHVHPRVVHVRQETPDPESSAFVVVEADCDWDEENGLMMVWERGQILKRVSQDDGFLTNVAAFSDPRLQNVIYKSGSQDFTTYVEA